MTKTMSTAAESIAEAATAENVRYDWDTMLDQLFELLDEKGKNGATLVEISKKLGVGSRVARAAIVKLRQDLAEDKAEETIIVVPNGRERQYVLTNDVNEEWVDTNTKSMVTRVKMMRDAYAAAERAAQGEKRKQYAALVRQFARIEEDLTALAE